ncbi:MAG: M1 family aminopeptidase, partial [Thermoanaerobaculia bacterium]
ELGAPWYPRPVSTAAAAHTFHAVIRARKPFTPFASGDVVRREADEEWNLLETKMTRPAPFVMVVAGTYTIQEETRDGVTCRVASYAVSKEKSGARLTNLFHKLRAFYEPYLGPFPWKEYTIIEMNDYGFGQAPPGMMRITHEAFQSNIFGDREAELFSGGINERLAHEIAHAYWGGVVWSANREDQWLEEAFAETSAGRAIEEMKDKADFKRLSNIWRTRASDSKSAAPIPLANEMVDKASLMPTHDAGADRTRLLYFKGPTLLLAIRKEVGDEVFFTVLKSFVKSFEKRPAVTTEDFVGLLSFITKKDWKPWFEKYFYGFELP